MMRSSLRTKILLSVGLIIFVVLGTSTLVHIQNLRRNYLEAFEWRSEALAQNILNAIAEMYKYNPQIGEMLGVFSRHCIELYESNKEKKIEHFAVIDTHNVIVAHNDENVWGTLVESPVLLDHLKRRELTTVLDGTTYHTLIPIVMADDTFLGTIDIGVPKRVVDEKVNQILLQAVGLFALFLILAFFPVSLLVHVFVIKPVAKLTRSSSAIASGALDQQVDVKGTDELGILAHSFATMRDAIREKINELQRLNADLDQRVEERTAELEALQHLMRRIMNAAEQLGNASDNLTQISAQMAAGAEQTSHQVHVVSSNSQQISQRVHDASVATEEVTVNIQEISRNVQEVSTITTRAVDISNAANATITSLETHSQEIGNISKVITDITQQTNLLALNATIEAARAGEFGKGFAVVANEVKDLARETAISAEDITHKIEAIQTSSRKATDAMTNVTEITRRVSELSTAIASAISQQSHVMNEISLTITDTAQGSDEITRTIAEVAANARGSSERATRVQEGAQVLSSLAEQFRQLVEEFEQ